MANDAVLEDGTAENVHAMIDTAKEFGKYSIVVQTAR
jgi:hypothetical protein